MTCKSSKFWARNMFLTYEQIGFETYSIWSLLLIILFNAMLLMVCPSFEISTYNKFLQDNVACLRLLQLLFAHSRSTETKQARCLLHSFYLIIWSPFSPFHIQCCSRLTSWHFMASIEPSFDRISLTAAVVSSSKYVNTIDSK